jgi:hypothetical protein
LPTTPQLLTAGPTTVAPDELPSNLRAMLARGQERLAKKQEQRADEEARLRREREAIGEVIGAEWAAVSEHATVDWHGHIAYVTLRIPGATAIQCHFQKSEGAWQWLDWRAPEGVHIVAHSDEFSRWQVETCARRMARYGRLDEALARAREEAERRAR